MEQEKRREADRAKEDAATRQRRLVEEEIERNRSVKAQRDLELKKKLQERGGEPTRAGDDEEEPALGAVMNLGGDDPFLFEADESRRQIEAEETVFSQFKPDGGDPEAAAETSFQPAPAPPPLPSASLLASMGLRDVDSPLPEAKPDITTSLKEDLPAAIKPKMMGDMLSELKRKQTQRAGVAPLDELLK